MNIIMAPIADDYKILFDVLTAFFVCLQVVEFEKPSVGLAPF